MRCIVNSLFEKTRNQSKTSKYTRGLSHFITFLSRDR